MGLKPPAHFVEIHGAMALMKLYRVSSAMGDLGTGFSSQVDELMAFTGLAARPGVPGFDFGVIVAPEVEGEQRAAQLVAGPDQDLQRLGGLNGANQVDGAVEDAGGIAGLD